MLKFAIKHDNDPEFKDLTLVNSYIQVLKEIEGNLNEIFNGKARKESALDFNSLLYSLFKDDFEDYKNHSEETKAIDKSMQEFRIFIDTKEKRELIRDFELVMSLTDMALDRAEDDEEGGGLWWLEEVDKELSKISTCFEPIINKVKKNI